MISFTAAIGYLEIGVDRMTLTHDTAFNLHNDEKATKLAHIIQLNEY